MPSATRFIALLAITGLLACSGAAAGRHGVSGSRNSGVSTTTDSSATTTTAGSITSGQATSPAASDNNVQDIKNEASDVAKQIQAALVRYRSVAFGVGIAAGTVFTFAGYRLFPATMFITAAALSGGAAFLLLNNTIDDTFGGKAAVVISSTAAIGLFCGAAATLLRKLGVFAAGASGGVAGAIALNASVLCHLPLMVESVPHLYLYVAAVVLGVAAGVLAFRLEAPIVMSATSVAGSFAVIAGIKYFIDGAQELTLNTYDDRTTWAYMAGWVVLALLGFVIQWRQHKARERRRRSAGQEPTADLESGRPVTLKATARRRSSLLLNEAQGAATTAQAAAISGTSAVPGNAPAVYLVPLDDSADKAAGAPSMSKTPTAPRASGTYTKI